MKEPALATEARAKIFMLVERRSAQSKSGITIRTRKGTPIFPESSPQNAVAFGVDNIACPNGGTLLSAPGSGKCWVITSLVVSFNPAVNNSVRVGFTGGMNAQASMPGSPTAPTPPPAQVITAPTAMGDNSSFTYGSAGSGNFSIAGSAYKATVASITNPQTGQVIATPIDSDPAGDLG